MKKIKIKLVLLITSMFLIAGCGGEGSKEEISADSLLITIPDNISPVAQVNKLNMALTQGETLLLDASQSSDEDGIIVKYEWQLSTGKVLGGKAVLYYDTSLLTPDTYSIRLIVTDEDGATDVKEIAVIVKKKPEQKPNIEKVDTTPPHISMTGDVIVNIMQNTTYSDTGATAIDDFDGKVAVTSSGTVDSAKVGEYTITYTAKDRAGNIATAIRTVNVKSAFTITHQGVTYGVVTSPYTKKVWLDKNLGAARVCESYNDKACYGDYYQWGRNVDGHEDSGSSTTDDQATDINNAGKSFIKDDGSHDYDWAQAVDSDGSIRSKNWTKTDASSVCPKGFRVPTIAELKKETLQNGVTNQKTAFSSFLKLPSSGYRYSLDGSIKDTGSWGGLWSSSASATNASTLYFVPDNAGSSNVDVRADGVSIRCLKK
jgi:hypothetical protein